MSETIARKPRDPLVPPGGIECHASDLTATISAQMPLQTAQDRLAEFDQWIPIDGDPNQPIGKLVAENSSGPLRLGYGAWRDLLLGCQFTSGNGELITAGGRTMKNVAGYDLAKFMVGQRGIFGTLVSITTRTYKRPALALLAEFPESDQLLGQIIATPLRPRWAMLTSRSLFFGWLDDAPAINLFARSVAALEPKKVTRRTLAEDISHRQSHWTMPSDYFRASVPPSKILAFSQQAGVGDWSADAAFGIVVGPTANLNHQTILEAARAVDGTAVLHIDGQPPRWQPSPTELLLLQSLKNSLDPDDRLLPLTPRAN
ncbi:MAG: FAD-binding oxidoreductase [Planctomycetota bacterium]|nr:FAD-binding oxidoreductase [Planctomycetota bacterium]